MNISPKNVTLRGMREGVGAVPLLGAALGSSIDLIITGDIVHAFRHSGQNSGSITCWACPEHPSCARGASVGGEQRVQRVFGSTARRA